MPRHRSFTGRPILDRVITGPTGIIIPTESGSVVSGAPTHTEGHSVMVTVLLDSVIPADSGVIFVGDEDSQTVVGAREITRNHYRLAVC